MKEALATMTQTGLNTLRAAAAEGGQRPAECLQLLGDILGFYRKYWDITMEAAFATAMEFLREPADHLLAAAIDADLRGFPDAAASLAGSAAALRPAPHYRLAQAALSRKGGRIHEARAICRSVSSGEPEYLLAAESEQFACDVAEKFWKRDYYDLFAEIHSNVQPRVYIEIGVAMGRSLALCRTGTRALGIDPATAEQESLLFHSPENEPQLYKMPSDAFFDTHDVRLQMGAAHFDLAFIDGLHHFDQALRDFINLEKFAGPDSVIMIHDCLPINPKVAERERSTYFWTGDVWKVILCLRAVRPDLEIVTLPLQPSGVALVRRLDPSSTILGRQFNAVVQHFDAIEMPEQWDEMCRSVNVLPDEDTFDVLRFFKPGAGR